MLKHALEERLKADRDIEPDSNRLDNWNDIVLKILEN